MWVLKREQILLVSRVTGFAYPVNVTQRDEAGAQGQGQDTPRGPDRNLGEPKVDLPGVQFPPTFC